MSVKKNSAPSIDFQNQPPVTNISRGPSNLLIILLVAVSFFAGYLFFKVKNLEQKNTQINNQAPNNQAPNNQANANPTSPLSSDNLKKYAKDLGLNANKFNTCLDQNQKKQSVETDLNQGESLGVRGTPGFFIDGRLLGGAFPFEAFKEIIDKEIAGTGSTSCKDYSQDIQHYCDETGNDPQKPFKPLPKNVDVANTPARGASNAKVALVEFSDFECPYCIRAYPTVKQILKAYPDDVKFYYKNLPLRNIHPNAQRASEAALCAGDQNKFWEYHDKLFEVQS